MQANNNTSGFLNNPPNKPQKTNKSFVNPKLSGAVRKILFNNNKTTTELDPSKESINSKSKEFEINSKKNSDSKRRSILSQAGIDMTSGSGTKSPSNNKINGSKYNAYPITTLKKSTQLRSTSSATKKLYSKHGGYNSDSKTSSILAQKKKHLIIDNGIKAGNGTSPYQEMSNRMQKQIVNPKELKETRESLMLQTYNPNLFPRKSVSNNSQKSGVPNDILSTISKPQQITTKNNIHQAGEDGEEGGKTTGLKNQRNYLNITVSANQQRSKFIPTGSLQNTNLPGSPRIYTKQNLGNDELQLRTPIIEKNQELSEIESPSEVFNVVSPIEISQFLTGEISHDIPLRTSKDKEETSTNKKPEVIFRATGKGGKGGGTIVSSTVSKNKKKIIKNAPQNARKGQIYSAANFPQDNQSQFTTPINKQNPKDKEETSTNKKPEVIFRATGKGGKGGGTIVSSTVSKNKKKIIKNAPQNARKGQIYSAANFPQDNQSQFTTPINKQNQESLEIDSHHTGQISPLKFPVDDSPITLRTSDNKKDDKETDINKKHKLELDLSQLIRNNSEKNSKPELLSKSNLSETTRAKRKEKKENLRKLGYHARRGKTPLKSASKGDNSQVIDSSRSVLKKKKISPEADENLRTIVEQQSDVGSSKAISNNHNTEKLSEKEPIDEAKDLIENEICKIKEQIDKAKNSIDISKYDVKDIEALIDEIECLKDKFSNNEDKYLILRSSFKDLLLSEENFKQQTNLGLAYAHLKNLEKLIKNYNPEGEYNINTKDLYKSLKELQKELKLKLLINHMKYLYEKDTLKDALIGLDDDDKVNALKELKTAISSNGLQQIKGINNINAYIEFNKILDEKIINYKPNDSNELNIDLSKGLLNDKTDSLIEEIKDNIKTEPLKGLFNIMDNLCQEGNLENALTKLNYNEKIKALEDLQKLSAHKTISTIKKITPNTGFKVINDINNSIPQHPLNDNNKTIFNQKKEALDAVINPLINEIEDDNLNKVKENIDELIKKYEGTAVHKLENTSKLDKKNNELEKVIKTLIKIKKNKIPETIKLKNFDNNFLKEGVTINDKNCISIKEKLTELKDIIAEKNAEKKELDENLNIQFVSLDNLQKSILAQSNDGTTSEYFVAVPSEKNSPISEVKYVTVKKENNENRTENWYKTNLLANDIRTLEEKQCNTTLDGLYEDEEKKKYKLAKEVKKFQDNLPENKKTTIEIKEDRIKVKFSEEGDPVAWIQPNGNQNYWLKLKYEDEKITFEGAYEKQGEENSVNNMEKIESVSKLKLADKEYQIGSIIQDESEIEFVWSKGKSPNSQININSADSLLISNLNLEAVVAAA